MLDNVRLGPKMIGAFVVMALMCAVVAFMGIRGIGRMDECITDMGNVQMPTILTLSQLRMAQQEARVLARDCIVAVRMKQPDLYQKKASDLEKAWAQLEDGIRKYEAIEHSAEERRQWTAYVTKLREWKKSQDETVAVAVGGDPDRGWDMMITRSLFAGVKAEFDKVQENEVTEAVGAVKDSHEIYASARLGALVTVIVVVVLSIMIGTLLSRSITGPVERAVQMFREMARGHLRNRLGMKRGDEIGVLADSIDAFADDLADVVDTMQRISEGDLAKEVHAQDAQDEIRPALRRMTLNLRSLVADADMLSKAAVEGRLSTRADASRHQGEYRKVVEGVNATLDAVISPLQVAADYVDSISKGVIPRRITDSYNGDFNTIKNNLNACIDGLAGLEEANAVLQRMAVNDYSLEIRGTYVGVFDEVKRAVHEVRGRVENAIRYVQEISTGDLHSLAELRRVGRHSERDELTPAFVQAMENLHRLVTDVDTLARAAVEGRLETRADVARHQGEFAKVVQGFNHTLDAVIGPLNVAADYVDRISKGDIPPHITDAYHGDFNTLKKNINACIDGLGGLLEANHVLQAMAVNDYRTPVTGVYVGVFDEVKKAVNVVQDRVRDIIRVMTELSRGELGQLARLKSEGKRSSHDELMPSLISTMESVDALVADATRLSQAAVEGRLGYRADATRHQGQYRQVVEGVNQTLDAVLVPINEAAQVLDRLAERDLTVRVQGTYQGDLANIKTALNRAVDNLHDALSNVTAGSEQVLAASTEISAGSQSLAEGAARQAGSLEEVSSALTEMASMTRQNTANAKEARNLSEGARTACETGFATMGSLTHAMEGIKASSQATAKIIKTIDEIAFQTNLLALNAAVEAARAGDAGRGFAVVADEVRNLAMRSAEAAKNTSDLIQEAVNNANTGVSINEQVLEHLQAIGSHVRKVSEVMGEIATASEQQSQGVEQINGSVNQMNALTQQVAANAEESASAAEELSAQASEMQSMVAQFRLGLQASASHAEPRAMAGSTGPAWRGGGASRRRF